MSQEQGHQIYSLILRDYATWFGEVMRTAFYSTDAKQREGIVPPAIAPALEPHFQSINQTIPDQIFESEIYLAESTKKLLAGNKAPDADTFQKFWQAYEGMLGLLHRLEKDEVMAGSGIDPETGLRSAAVMLPDLERELERRARRGQPFCIALTRIDGDENNKDPEKRKLAVICLKKTVRSFDDAYVTGQGDFLVSLKHADVNGGLKFSVRLNDALKRNENVNFTMSCCVAEPMPGDNMEELITNTRVDLNHIAQLGAGASGQYEDLSPLSRYVQSLKDS